MKILYLLLIIFSFLSCSKNIELLPKNICELTISQKLTGAKASSYVNNLHFNDVTQEGNEVGFYSGMNKAVIYITYYSFELDAQQNFSKMINKISPLNSPFSNISSIEVEGKIIYKHMDLVRCILYLSIKTISFGFLLMKVFPIVF